MMMTSVKFPRISLEGVNEYGSPNTRSTDQPLYFPPIVAMETVQKPASFLGKKDSFVPLRLGPVDRSKTLADSSSSSSYHHHHHHLHSAPPTTTTIHQAYHHNSSSRQRKTHPGGGGGNVTTPATTAACSKTDVRLGVSRKYPRIIVRDVQGRTLDTFTTLQEAIYRASWARKKKGEWPKTQLEWRLPKAPVPSKPDFSRAGPRSVTSLPFDPTSLRRDHVIGLSDNLSLTSQSIPKSHTQINLTADVLVNVPTLEIPVDDVSFVAQSLQYLPNLPSFTFLRHSLLAGQSTYIQVVASILLHQKRLKATQARNNDWEFPGFCSGCKRAGFCYGCSKSNRPHIHQDVPQWTGGGFRFWKRDRPRGPHSWKNPNNWRLPSTEQELQDIIRKYGGLAAYENAVISARREMITSGYDDLNDLLSQDAAGRDGTKLERITTLGSYPPQVTIVSTDVLDDDRYDNDDIDESLIDERLRTREGEEEGGSKDEEASRLMKEMIMKRMDARRERSRSRSYDSSRGRRRRRIGVTSYKEDSMSLTSQSQSGQNMSVTSDGTTTVRIDTGLGDELEDGEMERADTGEEEDGVEDGKKVRINVAEDERGRKISRLSTTMSMRSQSDTTGRKVSQASSSSPSRSRKTSRLTYRDEAKEMEEQEEAKRRKERAMQSIPFAKKRRDNLYKAPKFFVVQKKTRRITASKDPFSTDRDLDLPKGPAFQLKKNDRKQTKFVEFQRGDRSWKAPKAFEVKKNDTQKTKFWSPTVKKETDDDKKKRRGQSNERGLRRSKTDASTDSGHHSLKDGTDGGDGLGDDKDGLGDGSNQDNDGGRKSPEELEEEEGRPKRREVVKKSRKERERPPTPPQSPPRLPSPPQFRRRKSRTPTPSPPRTPTPPTPDVPLPEIELPSVPDLPTIGEKQPEARKQRMKFAVEAPPSLKEVKKKRRPPPKVRIIPKGMYKQRKTRPAEAPVTQEELMDIQDPLDFLAKYCIINPDRLPFYEIIFESTVAEQEPLYTKEEEKKKEENGENENDHLEEEDEGGKKKRGKSKKKKQGKDQETSLDEVIKPDLLPANRGMDIGKSVMTVEEQHLEKLIYTLDLLHDKIDKYSAQLANLEDQRTRLLADRARDTFPEVTAPDYFPKTKKKGKKGKKNKVPDTPHAKLRPDQITNDVIVARLDDKMLKELYHDSEIHNVDIEMNRLKEKIMDVQNRVEEIASEKLLADAFCMNHFFLRQGLSNNNNNINNNNSTSNNTMTPEQTFRRQQSELYNKLHPDPDFEMNMDEVEGALQQINNHLLTEKEFAFLFNVLNLPGRTKINFRLFSIIAALSEKVTQLDPVIKRMMNNFNYNALDIKMEKCKELFDLLEADNMPKGGATASSLVVELTAGGLRPENIGHVLHKFNRENRGVVDFLDFVTYVPLFVEIHKRIISDPLKAELDL